MTRDIFHVIADQTRRLALDVLRDQTLSVNEISAQFPLTQSAVSQHLKVMREAGLVQVTRSGRQRLYTADPRPLLEVFEWVQHYRAFWPKNLDALERYLDREAE